MRACQVGRAVEGARLKRLSSLLVHIYGRGFESHTCQQRLSCPFLVLAVIHVKMMEDGCPTKSVDGVTVSIAAFQAVDLGSIPGRRNVHFLWNFHRFPCDVI